MKFLQHLILRLLPLGVIAGVVAVLFSSGGSVPSERVEALNLSAGPGAAYTQGSFDALLSAENSAGVEYIREVLDWSQIETTQGTYNWSAPLPYAAIFAAEKAQGKKVIAVLNGGPAYLTPSSGSAVDSTQFLLRWANFVQAAVDQFSGQVDVWEIGSQINTSTGMSPFITPSDPGGSTAPDPALYAKMVKVVNKIVKAADPNEEVWMGSLVSAASGNCAMNPLTFLLEVNGAKGWDSLDSVEYSPARGALAPEAAQTAASSACASTLPVANTTLSGETAALQDLARQLGGKTVRIEGLGWSADELTALTANRSISADQLLADYLTRATAQLAGSNNLTSFFWQIDPTARPASFTALSNLNSVLAGAKFESQPQGQSGSVFEYRFSKGSQWIIIAWHAQDGDTPIPVALSNLSVSSLMAYAVDAAGFTSTNGTAISVDASGTATVLLNERPVVFLGHTSDLATAAQQEAASQMDQWKYELKLSAHHGVNQLKAAMLHALENMFESAKDQVVQWGEDKLNSLLN